MVRSLLVLLLLCPTVMAQDWPAWRYDASHSAASPHDLPANLAVTWTHTESPRVPTWDDPLNNDLMPFDRVFEPIILDGRVYVGFNDADKVVCWDVATGEECWTFFTDGPVRFPPVGANGRIYVVSDDGYLYCLRADRGTLEWKFRGGPTEQRVLGNRRVISMWPARGGPVVRDDTVYFAAGIWPWLGTFLYALDAQTGAVRWVNDSTAADYIKQPHSAASFGGVAPQGTLAATADFLVVPGGRSIPAVFDRHRGHLIHFLLNEGGKGTGGAFVMTRDNELFVHTRLRGVRKLDLVSGKKTEVMLNEPVLSANVTYTSDATAVRAYDRADQLLWEYPTDGQFDLIQAGKCLYAAGASEVSVLRLDPDLRIPPQRVETLPVQAQRLIAGAETLIAVTSAGAIQAYRAQTPDVVPRDLTLPPPAPRTASPRLASFLAEQEADAGYAILFGCEATNPLLDEILASSTLHCVVIDPDEARIGRLRAHYDATRDYGRRVTFHVGTPETFRAPPYIAHLVIVSAADQKGWLNDPALQTIFASVRPYGGLLWFLNSRDKTDIVHAVQAAQLPHAKILESSRQELPNDPLLAEGVLVQRVGPLEGSAPWTHLYGNMANTVKSNDQRVRLPLGILWFGGASHMDVLPRHSHSPSEQVIGGRLFVEGMNCLSARDVYTGRVLWRRDFGDLGTAGVYYDETYKDTPLDPAYNQVHIPGANARGTNYVASEDRIYVAIGAECHVLDSRSGNTLQVIQLPPAPDERKVTKWTYIGLQDNILFAGTDFANYAQREQFTFEASSKRGTAWSPEWNGSRGLAALDAMTGQVLWQTEAKYSFLHNGIIAGQQTVFLLDKLPQSVENQRVRRGQPKPTDYRIVARDLRTGELKWERTEEVFGTWLSYSEPHNLVCQSGSAAPDRALDEVGQGIMAIHGHDGSIAWKNESIVYAGPPILHGDTLITNTRSGLAASGMYRLDDGAPVLISNPFSGDLEPWQYTRQHGCNTAIASEYLLTFRSGAASYYDLKSQCGVGNWGGFRSGCSSNLIVADGVLNAPDFTRTCSCGYQNQTSLALVHMPDLETWSIPTFRAPSPTQPLQRLGVNFGAPGARKADDGTLWVEFPPVSEGTLPLDVQVEGREIAYFRRHSSAAQGTHPWVTASGVSGVERISLGSRIGRVLHENLDYEVRMYFAEPHALPSRPLQIAVQGEVLEPNFDLPARAGGPWKSHVVRCENVRPLRGTIEIQLTSLTSDQVPVISGIELILSPRSSRMAARPAE